MPVISKLLYFDCVLNLCSSVFKVIDSSLFYPAVALDMHLTRIAFCCKNNPRLDCWKWEHQTPCTGSWAV